MKPRNEYIDIPKFEGLYAVTRDGRIWSYPKLTSHKKGKWMKTHLDPKKYPFVSLRKDGVYHQLRIHRILADVFIPKVVGKNDVNHINGIRHDNRLENLEWCNKSENMKHAYRTGLVNKEKFMKSCIKSVSKMASMKRKLSYDEADCLRKDKINGLRGKELREKYGVSSGIISQILRNKSYVRYK